MRRGGDLRAVGPTRHRRLERAHRRLPLRERAVGAAEAVGELGDLGVELGHLGGEGLNRSVRVEERVRHLRRVGLETLARRRLVRERRRRRARLLAPRLGGGAERGDLGLRAGGGEGEVGDGVAEHEERRREDVGERRLRRRGGRLGDRRPDLSRHGREERVELMQLDALQARLEVVRHREEGALRARHRRGAHRRLRLDGRLRGRLRGRVRGQLGVARAPTADGTAAAAVGAATAAATVAPSRRYRVSGTACHALFRLHPLRMGERWRRRPS